MVFFDSNYFGDFWELVVCSIFNLGYFQYFIFLVEGILDIAQWNILVFIKFCQINSENNGMGSICSFPGDGGVHCLVSKFGDGIVNYLKHKGGKVFFPLIYLFGFKERLH